MDFVGLFFARQPLCGAPESAQKPGFSQGSSSGVSHLGQKPGFSNPASRPRNRVSFSQFMISFRSWAETRFLYPGE